MNHSSKKALALIGIGLPLLAVGMNFSIVNMAVSTLQKYFDAPISHLQWLLNVLGISVSVFLVTMGKLADAYGRRRLYLIGTVILAGASLLSGLAPALIWIIVAQALQGIGCAIILPISQALLSHLYPEEKRSQAIALWAALACMSLALGPLIGGILLETVGWRWIFFINIPAAVIAFFLILKAVEESKSVRTNSKIDTHGLILLIIAIGSLITAIMQAPEWGWKALYPTTLFLLAITLFIRSEKRSSAPIIRPDFFLRRTFLLATLANSCIIFFVWADFFLMPFFLQHALNFSPFQAGLLMLLVTVPVVLFSSLVGKLYAKTGPKLLLVSGFLLLALSALCQRLYAFDPLSLLFIAALSFGFGWVIAWGPSITTGISSVPRDAAGIASGAFTTVQEIGGTLGLAIAGTVFRLAPDLSTGYQNGAATLLFISLLGLAFSLFLRPQKET